MGLFTAIGNLTAGRPWVVCATWLVVGASLAFIAPPWSARSQDDDIRFLPARCDSVRGYQLLEKAFPQDVFASRLVFAVERDRPLSTDDLALVDGMTDALNRLRQAEPELQIRKIYSYHDPFVGSRLISHDRRCALIQVSLGTPYLALQTRATVDRAEEVVRAALPDSGSKGVLPRVYTTGPAGVGRDLVTASADSLESTTLATVVLVVVILLFVYRSPLMAFVPLACIAVAVWVSLNVLSLCTLIPGFYLVNISEIFAVVMLYGAGTDYCLFLISRYREELALGNDGSRAVGRAVGGVGWALAASAGTVICGLGLMATAEFAKVRSSGPAIAVSLAVALLASVTLTPALLRLLGRAAFWPCRAPERKDLSNEGIWGPISRLVVRHPFAVGLVAALLLLPLAVVGLGVRPTYKATAELARTCDSVAGMEAIQRHFTAGEVGPVTVLLDSPREWDTEEGRRVLAHVSRVFTALPNVAEVRGLTQPLGKAAEPEKAEPAALKKQKGNPLFSAVWNGVVQNVADRIARTTRSFYAVKVPAGDGTTRHVTRLDVVMHTDPFDPQSNATLEMLQLYLRDELPWLASSLGEVRAECYGITVCSRDLAKVTESDRQRINLLVLAGILVILLALVRNPILAGYLLLTVLLSYYATLGATAVLAHVWHGRPLGEIDWRVPFFLFTILVAVGEDYNILLVSRALEERARFGGVEGTRRALARTGGTITSCGLIMAGTFATLMLAGLNTLVQVGFALAFGVLLDTFIVRPLLVPAFTVWLWRNVRPRVPALPKPVPQVASRRAA